MSRELWIIEARNEDGTLNFDTPQAHHVFGDKAVSGFGVDALAKAVFARSHLAKLRGDNIPQWPSFVDSRFKARRKTW